MASIPVRAVCHGIQSDGHWQGTPCVIVRLMDHRDADPLPTEAIDDTFPLLDDGDYTATKEVSLDQIVKNAAVRTQCWSMVGISTLLAVIKSYRERHVLIMGNEIGRHGIESLVGDLLAAGRTVQIETTPYGPTLPGAWLSYLHLPRHGVGPPASTDTAPADEVLAAIRWRSDLQRAEMNYAKHSVPVWLRPSRWAETGVYSQCVAAAIRHQGWRAMPPVKVRASA